MAGHGPVGRRVCGQLFLWRQPHPNPAPFGGLHQWDLQRDAGGFPAGGPVLAPYLPEGSLPVLCFLLLAGLGIVKIFDSSLKALIRRHRDLHKEWQFSAFHLRVILNIYANPEQADQDRSGSLSLGEAAALAVALSLDSLTVGIGAGLGQTPVGEAVLLSFLMGVGAILLGRWLGDRMTKGIRMDLSWVSGAMLLVLAGAKLM